jgi:hypothetical protein
MPLPPIEPTAVFLNIPYDEDFRPLYLAFIAGLYQLKLVPYIAAGIPGGERRLDRIFSLIQRCRYSIHDVSRVEVDLTPPLTPRFNMPFELGLSVAWAKVYPRRHTWFLWESKPRRIQISMSDLDGTDAYIHSGTVDGVLSELRNAFVRRDSPPFSTMLDACRVLEGELDRILHEAGTKNLYSASVFKSLCLVSLDAVRRAGSIRA